jgi:hypothetical protein
VQYVSVIRVQGREFPRGDARQFHPYTTPPLYRPSPQNITKRAVAGTSSLAWKVTMYRTARIARVARPGALGVPPRSHDIFRSSGSRMRYTYNLHILFLYSSDVNPCGLFPLQGLYFVQSKHLISFGIYICC